MAASSGWNPGEISKFFVTLERETKLEQGEQRPSFFDSHPMTSERAQTTAARARALTVAPAPPIAATQSASARVRRPGSGTDPAQGVIPDGVPDPGLDLAMTSERWEIQNRQRGGSRSRARAW